MRISVWDSRELQALLLALRGFDRDLQKEIRQRTKAIAQPAWQQEVAERAETKLEQKVLASTARVQVSNQNVMLRSAAIGRSLSGGLKPSASFAAVEFGANKVATTYQTHSKKGKPYQVTRRTREQLRPRNKKGYVVFPAAAAMIPRLAALWAQTTVRTFYETIERANRG